MTRADHPTVLIVDDEFDIRLLLRALLEMAHLDIEVVGEAEDGDDALAEYRKLDPPDVPDVVILDNRMPNRSGMEVAAEILAGEPRQHVILFSAFITPELRAEAQQLGVSACVDKTHHQGLPALIVELAGSPGR